MGGGGNRGKTPPFLSALIHRIADKVSLLGRPLVLGRAHRYPLKAHLLVCAVGQQGAELDLKPFCRSSRARRDLSAQVSLLR